MRDSLIDHPYRPHGRSARTVYAVQKRGDPRQPWVDEPCFSRIEPCTWVWTKSDNPLFHALLAVMERDYPDVKSIGGCARIKTRHWAATNLLLYLLRLGWEYPRMALDVMDLRYRGFSMPSALIMCQLHEPDPLHLYAVGLDDQWKPSTPDPWDLRSHYVVNHQLFEKGRSTTWKHENKLFIQNGIHKLEEKRVSSPNKLANVDWSLSYELVCGKVNV